MAIVYCTKNVEFDADEVEEVLNTVEISRISTIIAYEAKAGDVYLYNYQDVLTKGNFLS